MFAPQDRCSVVTQSINRVSNSIETQNLDRFLMFRIQMNLYWFNDVLINRSVEYAAPAAPVPPCQLSICALMNLGHDLQSGGDELAGRSSSDPFGHGKWCQRTGPPLTTNQRQMFHQQPISEEEQTQSHQIFRLFSLVYVVCSLQFIVDLLTCQWQITDYLSNDIFSDA